MIQVIVQVQVIRLHSVDSVAVIQVVVASLVVGN
jgi:hypothetical protein